MEEEVSSHVVSKPEHRVAYRPLKNGIVPYLETKTDSKYVTIPFFRGGWQPYLSSFVSYKLMCLHWANNANKRSESYKLQLN